MTDKHVKTKHDPTKTMSVADAGRKYFNIGRNAAYTAAKNGEIPTIRIGHRIVAVIPAIEKMLQQAGPAKNTAA
jgi:hypothetical protein